MLSPGAQEPVPPMVSTWTRGWGIAHEGVMQVAPASATWEAADVGVWVPIYIPSVCVARRMWWANGASVAGNVEAGIYLDATHKPGVKLITTGSTAQAGTSVIQFADITDTTLTQGLCWLFISCSSTSATFLRSQIDSYWDELARFEQSSIGPGSAPSTATPVETTAGNIYLFGFSTTTIT